MNINIKTGTSIHVIGTTYSAVDGNYWAGAKKACEDIGMSLPAIGSYSGGYCSADSAEDTLCGIYNSRNEYGITSDWFFSLPDDNDVYGMSFYNGGIGFSDLMTSQISVLCVGN